MWIARFAITIRSTAAAVLGAAFAVGLAGPAGAIAPPPGLPAVTAIEPASGAVVGVAAPITLHYAARVNDRAAAQHAVSLNAPGPLSGQFRWIDATTLQWQPASWWPASSAITVSAGRSVSHFKTGAALVAVANTSSHEFTVSINGAVVRTMPASMGKPGHETPWGTFPVLAKYPSIVMDSSTYGVPVNSPEGYRLTVYDAVRITWSGVFVHSAPWSVDSQGYANVSHGCINLSPANAEWYFDNVHIGDPVIVTG
ncbi:L,D-transpeptidase [Skermania sp. ID1734]|uniref:L,D-transpeptidase n=1 Tax=Skermania sp. ID1734 TaxID=2597516 RepID=UPI00117E9445|nr:L,D-transpeptidase [Skermania sp. ID1734]TSE01400.1 L,D-transpeptidase [Skermania sp. ID1734]